MLIREMTRELCIALLQSQHLGRIACAAGSQPYVTPFSFAYHENFIYSFATHGRKIAWMRANPWVCVEVDRIEHPSDWQTVVIFGRYEELPATGGGLETQELAHDLLAERCNWWEPGYTKTILDGAERPLVPIYFRVAITEISGHEGSA